YWELWGLVSKITSHAWRRALMMCAGAIYIGLACFTLVTLRSPFFGMSAALMLVGAVIATDIGAYFVGRNIGGPKIAPRISPSKTWSGLAGGMFAAGLALVGIAWLLANSDLHMGIWYHFGVGAMIAVIAQIGDFFQSWLKRRAGVKDSGNLIPGHGGLFDRADGLIAVLFVTGAIASVAWVGA
ncbi:MAG: phosphatidate cytidylyltransferase, partial [Sphingorhabdus sp.]